MGNWSLIFTPVFGAVLVSKNWRALGEPERASRALIWSFLSAPFVLLGVGFPLLIVWYFASNRPQARYVKQRWGGDYPRKPWANTLALTFGIWVLVLAAIVGFVLGSRETQGASTLLSVGEELCPRA